MFLNVYKTHVFFEPLVTVASDFISISCSSSHISPSSNFRSVSSSKSNSVGESIGSGIGSCGSVGPGIFGKTSDFPLGDFDAPITRERYWERMSLLGGT